MRVLIVDDNRALAENLGEILEEEGHHVRLAEDPGGAMSALAAESMCVDFALIDICLGREDGVALAERLRRRCPELRLALMTAYSSAGRVHHARTLSLGPIFPKPVPVEALVRLLAS